MINNNRQLHIGGNMSAITSASRRASIEGIDRLRTAGETKSELDTVKLFCKIMKKMESISEGA